MAFGDLLNHTQRDAGSVSSDDFTLPFTTSAHSILAVGSRLGGTGAFTESITDNSLNAYTQGPTDTHTALGAGFIHFITNIAGSAAEHVKITLDSARTLRYAVFEFAGLGTSASDGSAHANGLSTSPDSGALVTAVTDALFGFITVGANFNTTPFTAGTSNGFTWRVDEEMLNISTIRFEAMDMNGAKASGTYDALGTFTTNSDDWVALLQAFKDTSSGPTVTYPELERQVRGANRGMLLGAH